MSGIRVDNGAREIEVNDKGECIQVFLDDGAFMRKFAGVLEYFEEKSAELQKWEEEQKKNYPHKEGEMASTEEIVVSTEKYDGLCRETCAKLDELFGEGCCRKVFGENSVPGIKVIGSFFVQMREELFRLKTEWDAKLQKEYNNNRKGARSK